MKPKFYAFVALALSFLTATASATPIAINPVSDGSLYVCNGCNVVQNDAYVLTAGYIQGAIKFSSAAVPDTATSVVLSLNPYGLPLFGPLVDVYGYGTSIGVLDVSDANAGIFLGTLALPADLGYGTDAYFDVTDFATSVSAPYIAFNLRSIGTNVFSSLEYNYGHPAQLLITSSVPEPMAAMLLLLGLLGIATSSCRSQKSGRASALHGRASLRERDSQIQ